MRRISEFKQLLIGMSMSRYLPPMGTAGLERAWVSGNSRVAASASQDDCQNVAHVRRICGKAGAGQDEEAPERFSDAVVRA